MALNDGSSGGLFRLDTTTGKVEPELVGIRVVRDVIVHETVRGTLNTFLLDSYTGDTRDKAILISGGLVL